MSKKTRKTLGRFESPALTDASKTLLANIRFASVDSRLKTIVVTSSTVDEGKTSVSTNLACAIASSGQSVLIVETDMRRRCLASMLGVHPKHGLYSVLSGASSLRDAIIQTNYQNIYFLDAEPNIPSPPDILSTKRFAALVDKLRDSFDYVIFDTPPIGLFVDAAIVSNLVDGTLFVIRERFAKRAEIVASIQQLKAANARILGTVLTFCKDTPADYYYAYYTEDGRRADKAGQDFKTVSAAALPDADTSSWEDVGAGRKGRFARPAATRSRRESRDENAAQDTSARSAAERAGAHGASATANPYAPRSFQTKDDSASPRHRPAR